MMILLAIYGICFGALNLLVLGIAFRLKLKEKNN